MRLPTNLAAPDRLLVVARCDACAAMCCAQPSSFELDLDTSSFGEYTRGGIVVQSKEHKTLAFKTLAQVGGWVGERGHLCVCCAFLPVGGLTRAPR